LVLGVALGLLASLVLLGAVYVWWLGGGLLRVYTTGQAKADVAQKQLKLMQKSITAGDEKGARRHLGIAERAVNDAETAARAPQVRVAKWLPYTRGTVTDLDHLLGAASVVIDAADNALTLYTEFSGDTSKLFDNGKVDVNALVRGRDALRKMESALTQARSELLAVKGDRSARRRRTEEEGDWSQADPGDPGSDPAVRPRGRGPARGPGRGGHQALPGGRDEPGRDAWLWWGTAQRRPGGLQGRQDDDPQEGDDVVHHAGLPGGVARGQSLPRVEAGSG
jgi:hypothetical protein